MASNRLPQGMAEILSLGEKAASGAKAFGAAIPLKQNTEADIRADLDALIAANNAYDMFEGRRNAVEKAVKIARANAAAALRVTRDRFKPLLGAKPGERWAAIGWPANSLAVPRSEKLILPRLDSVKAHLAQHAEHEVAALNITAAEMHALHEALSDAVSARNSHKEEKKTALLARDRAERALRRRLRGLIGELKQRIEPLEARWLSFGLRKPGAPPVPDRVKNTRAEVFSGGKLRVRCDAAPRAERYQIWIQAAGADEPFRLVYSDALPDKVLEALPADAVISIKMRAVNDTGDGRFGETITVALRAASTRTSVMPDGTDPASARM